MHYSCGTHRKLHLLAKITSAYVQHCKNIVMHFVLTTILNCYCHLVLTVCVIINIKGDR